MPLAAPESDFSLPSFYFSHRTITGRCSTTQKTFPSPSVWSGQLTTWFGWCRLCLGRHLDCWRSSTEGGGLSSPVGLFCYSKLLGQRFCGFFCRSCSLPIQSCWYFGRGGRLIRLRTPCERSPSSRIKTFHSAPCLPDVSSPLPTCRGHISLPTSPLRCPS